MVLIYTLAVLLLTAAATVGLWYARKLPYAEKLRRAVALAVVPIAFYAYLIKAVALKWVRGLNMTLIPGYELPFGDNALLTLFSLILVWFTWAAMLTILMNEFFKSETISNIVRFFSLPVLILDVAFIKVYVCGIIGKYAFDSVSARLVMIGLELAVIIALGLSSILRDGFGRPSRDGIRRMLFALPFAIIAIMPSYIPQAIIGYLDPTIKVQDFTEVHRFMLYFAIIIPFLIFHGLKNKSPEAKRIALIYLSLALMWSYVAYWELGEFAALRNWPLHLCNTAMFIIPLCLIFKWDKLFYFCLFINVMGAAIAMLAPNTDSSVNALAFNRINFWINHYPAFFMPILLIALKQFKRPEFKEWCYSQIAFACYFVFVLFVNAWYGDTDFFFLNSDFILDKLGDSAKVIRDIEWRPTLFGRTLIFYPLYQALFYIVYVIISAGMWFLYEILFTLWDSAEDIRIKKKEYEEMKKKFMEYFGAKPVSEPFSGDDSPCIALKQFSKKYGANKHYSVDHATFTVKGGEIFGFLGPNGAGKSTIIKSMVGIQTVTSGSIEICGYDVEKQSVQAKLNLGFVPDHYALYENLTGREYINYIADLYSVSLEERNETIERMVTRFQLQGAFDNQMKTYSHGMKQKIAIMAALVHNPKVWILDEPLTGLDPTSIHEVKECMKEHAAKGNIVFFSSHIIDVVEKICDKIAIIKKGKIRAAATVAALERNKIDLEKFYLDTIYAEEDAPLVSIEGDDILCLESSLADVSEQSSLVGVAEV